MILDRAQQEEADCAEQQGQAHMPATFQAFVRAAGQQVHADQGTGIRHAGQQADGFQVMHTESANQCRHPVRHRIGATVDAEEHQPGDVHPGIAQHLRQAGIGHVCRAPLGKTRRQEVFFLRREPACIVRFIDQPEPAEQPQQHRRDAFEYKQHLPVAQAQPAMEMAHDGPGERPADDAGNHRRHQEHRGDARTQCGREPVRQVQDDTGKETGLGHAQQKACDDQLVRRGDKGRGHRDHAPQHHDASERGPGSNALQVHIARYFEQDVTQVENTGTDPVGGIRQPDVLGHA
ncbi:hypothetical protein D3C84_663430 [compost metagenome]